MPLSTRKHDGYDVESGRYSDGIERPQDHVTLTAKRSPVNRTAKHSSPNKTARRSPFSSRRFAEPAEYGQWTMITCTLKACPIQQHNVILWGTHSGCRNTSTPVSPVSVGSANPRLLIGDGFTVMQKNANIILDCSQGLQHIRSVNKKLTLRQIFIDGASAIFDTQKHPHRLTGVEILPLAFSVPLQMTRQ